MEKLNIYTIGFTQKKAEKFFNLLKESGIRRIIDTRLSNNSQLAGFAKKEDLKYFLKEICQIDYVHMEELAPTQKILDEYKKVTYNWNDYQDKFIKLLEQRKVEKLLTPELVSDSCFLCSEHEPHHCHRRLVAEYLQSKWKYLSINIEHLL